MQRSKASALLLALLFAGSAFAAGYTLARRSGTEPESAGPPSRSTGENVDIPVGSTAGELREILLQHDALQRTAALGQFLQGIGPESLEDVKAAYDSVFMDLGDVELILLAEWWARFDPEGAFAWSRGDWRARDPAVLSAVARAWARTDPAAVLARAPTLSDRERWAVVDAAIRGWD